MKLPLKTVPDIFPPPDRDFVWLHDADGRRIGRFDKADAEFIRDACNRLAPELAPVEPSTPPELFVIRATSGDEVVGYWAGHGVAGTASIGKAQPGTREELEPIRQAYETHQTHLKFELVPAPVDGDLVEFSAEERAAMRGGLDLGHITH